MPSGEMDTVYVGGVLSANRFEVIENDINEDPLELIRAAQAKPAKDPKAKGKKVVKPVEKKTVKIETPAENEASENKRNDRQRGDRGRGRGQGGRGRGGDRRGRGGSDRGGSDRRGRGGFRNNYNNNNNQEGFDNNNQGGFGSYQTQVADSNEGGFGSGFDNEERRGGRSGYRGRGGRGSGGRGRGRGGSREFDRRSGSDKSSVKPVDKKDGSGSYNWGTPQDDINEASEEHTGGFGTPKETEETPAENVEQTTEVEDAPEPVDEGPQEMTYEEYKKQLAESRTKPEFKERKVDVNKKEKGFKQLKKPTEEDKVAESSIFFPKKNETLSYKSSGRVKENLNVNIRYSNGENRHLDTTRRGQRPSRGGKRGGRREGGSGRDAEIALSNDAEFPSL